MKIEHDFNKYKGARYKWYGEGGLLCSAGFGCHSNVQINEPGQSPATYPTPLWWWFRV